MLNLIVSLFLLAIPIACECKTVAFSPSIPGQPLIFHFNTAFNQMQPSQFSAVTWTQLENALLVRSSYTRHLENLCIGSSCSKLYLWADGMAQWQHQDSGNKNQFGFNDITGGLTLGADTSYDDFLVGVAASYTHSNLSWKQSGGDSQIDSYYGGLFGSWDNGCIYVNASVLGAYSDYHKSRHFHYRSMDHHAHARHNSWEASTGFEAGMTLKDVFCCLDLVPFVGVDYVYLSQEGYSESGADRFNLYINRRNDQLLQSEVGLQFTRRTLCDFCNRSWTIAPNLSLSYVNQTSLTGRSFSTNFVGRDSGFSVKGWNFNRNLGEIALNFNFLDCSEFFNVTLHYDGQFGKNYWNQTGSIMCNLCF